MNVNTFTLTITLITFRAFIHAHIEIESMKVIKQKSGRYSKQSHQDSLDGIRNRECESNELFIYIVDMSLAVLFIPLYCDQFSY